MRLRNQNLERHVHWRRQAGVIPGLMIAALFFLLVCAQGQEVFNTSGIVPAEVDRTYTKGLQFLAKTQNASGFWADRPYGAEPAVVGLAVVSMLSHGDDPNTGPYSVAIRRGLDYILKQANPKTGYIGTSMYNHGFGTLALAESYGVVDDPRLGPALKKAVSLIVQSQEQNPFHAWRYTPESKDADTTVTGAQMVALLAARNAGLAVPESTIQNGLKFFASCQMPDGGVGYTSAVAPNGTRTAIMCLVYSLAKSKDSKVFKSAFDFFSKSPEEKQYAHYYLYYASQAFFHGSPEMWQNWNRENIKSLRMTQLPDGNWDGSFGPTFSTAGSLLSLALNYRYLPIYER